MTDLQDFNQKSNSTITKLLEVDSELASTEADLISQLKSIQEKRRSLQTVIGMFTTADTPAIPPVETDKETEVVDEDLTALPLEAAGATVTAASPPDAAAANKREQTKKTALSPTRKNKTTKFTQQRKAAKKVFGWQQYLREEFSNSSLSEAVTLVLQRQRDRVVEISAIVNAIFVDELPMADQSKARRQVSNVLSEGARQNKWYRTQLGSYSMSQTAAATNS